MKGPHCHAGPESHDHHRRKSTDGGMILRDKQQTAGARATEAAVERQKLRRHEITGHRKAV
jgi:hypothetical protein